MDLLHERYQIVRPLGSGGAGTTWLATDTRTGAQVTVKKLTTPLNVETREALERETRLLGQLDHPQIPQFIEAFTETWRMQDYLHLVLAYVEGEPLDQEMARRRYEQDEARALVEDLLAIVAWLHRLAPPVIHRDIKPSNVIRRPDGRVALIDFGLATDAIERTFMHTMAAGTLGYQAPEQIAGDPRPTSDVYSVGALAVELLTRTPPRDMLSGQSLRWTNRAAHLSPSWRAWLERALDPDPDRRFKDGAEALAALLAKEAPSPARPIGARTPEPPLPPQIIPPRNPPQPSGLRSPSAPRQQAILTFGMVGIAVMGIVIAVVFSATPSAEPQPAAIPSAAPIAPPTSVAGTGSGEASACRAGDDEACLRAAELLSVPTEFGSVPASNRKLRDELMGLACTRGRGHAEACAIRASHESEPADAAPWWARACVLEAEHACQRLASAIPEAPASRSRPIVRRLERDCAARDRDPDRRDLQASCALLYRLHVRGLGGELDPDAADELAASICPDHPELGCLPSDLQPLEL